MHLNKRSECGHALVGVYIYQMQAHRRHASSTKKKLCGDFTEQRRCEYFYSCGPAQGNSPTRHFLNMHSPSDCVCLHAVHRNVNQAKQIKRVLFIDLMPCFPAVSSCQHCPCCCSLTYWMEILARFFKETQVSLWKNWKFIMLPTGRISAVLVQAYLDMPAVNKGVSKFSLHYPPCPASALFCQPEMHCLQKIP